MKKQMKLVMVAILLTGATALAESPSDIEIMITNGKIAAVQEEQVEVVRNQIKRLSAMQDQIGTAQDIQDVKGQASESLSPSQHLLSDIGQQIDNAQQRLQDMQKSNNLDGITQLKDDLTQSIQLDSVQLQDLLNN